ncbi:HTH domain-containing protein [Enterococcus casseliflavus]|uniref:helix-turn-helix domain-containing protein n=1 Tax=Enterococcus casseliflavus TaxID=37734 RepID=UPI000F50EEE5|nr:helix-turn-helix domain-containing protein [Enterococcus casseliflavus]ROY44011.1 HTH domain-containing protein [Enterococcus casseliflavus]
MRELQIAFITNPVIRRWMRILKIIEREETFTTTVLAQRLGISQRTLMKDIQLIKEQFCESVVIDSNNSGFRFRERDRLLYQAQKEQLLEQDILFELLETLFYGEEPELGELADHYCYAETTLRRFLSNIQPILKEYELTLGFKPVRLMGEEANIRKFFFDFYYGGELTPQTVRPPARLHQLVVEALSEKIKTKEVGTGLSIGAFYSLLYLTMLRVQQEQFISVPKWAQELVYKEADFQLLRALVPIIEKEYDIFLPEEELVWLHLIIVSRRTTNRLDQEQLFLARFNQWPEVEETAKAYFSEAFFEAWDRPCLETFLSAFFASRKLNDTLWPIWNKQQAEARQLVMGQARYETNRGFLKSRQNDLSFSKTWEEDVAVSFSLFSELLLHTYPPKKTVLFLLEGDSMVVQTIRLQAQHLLGEQAHLVFLALHELTEARLKSQKIDLIVTNYRPYLFEYGVEEASVLLHPVPLEKDWLLIKQKLTPFLTSGSSEGAS